jgi:putative addiction module component (TIGR02574 family)
MDLSKTEQIRYLQALWDRITQGPGDIPVLESHLELAESRLRDYRDDPSKARNAFQVLDRLADNIPVATGGSAVTRP